MDPNEALRYIRKLTENIKNTIAEGIAPDPDSVNELADTWTGLDEWMSKGGFLPKDWAAGR